MTPPRITVVGASNFDLISYVPRLPRLGETLHGSRFYMAFGGKGANQAVMAAKLGGDVSLIAKLGRDLFGENMIGNFHSWGINTHHVFTTGDAATGVAPIVVDGDGRNAIIIVMGANDLLTPEDIESARATIAASQVVVGQAEIPLETTLAALRLARAAGVTTIFNPAPARPDMPAEVYCLSDIFCPNEGETELLTGMPVGTTEEATAAARALLARGAGTVILTLGERGCLLVTGDEATHAPAPRVQAVDTVGAGDAFVGSLAYFLGLGKPLPVAVERANHIAAVSVQASGAQPSFPGAADLPAELFM
jgi:ribokinase